MRVLVRRQTGVVSRDADELGRTGTFREMLVSWAGQETFREMLVSWA